MPPTSQAPSLNGTASSVPETLAGSSPGGGSQFVDHPANLTLTLAAEGEAAGICMRQRGSSGDVTLPSSLSCRLRRHRLDHGEGDRLPSGHHEKGLFQWPSATGVALADGRLFLIIWKPRNQRDFFLQGSRVSASFLLVPLRKRKASYGACPC